MTEEGGNGDSKRASFLGFVAHEVRNPLSTALWSAEILSRMPEGERAGARGERLTAMCLRSISRVRQLIEDHFLCERLDAGGIPVRREPVALREVLDAIVARPAAGRGDVALDVDGAVEVIADRALLERALDSLLAAAGAENASVRVSVRTDGGAIAVRVDGRAPGANALEDPEKGSPGDVLGRALALPLARRIVRALGGRLELAGSGYVLSLPRDQAYIARPNPASP